jgi:hypothetical protein
MTTDHDGQTDSMITLRMWTYAQAIKAVPYLRVLVRSLREQWLELRQAQQKLRRIDARDGRADREALIARQEIAREAARAEESLFETLSELTALDIYCLDPACGLALIPFRLGDELAWFVFDLFGPRELEAWRYHSDPLEARRPLVERSESVGVA